MGSIQRLKHSQWSRSRCYFLEFPCVFFDPADVGDLNSGFSAFSKSSLSIWKFSVYVLFKLSLKHFEHYLVSMWDECNYGVVWTFFGIDLWDWDEKGCFSSPMDTFVFQICWYIECSTITAPSLRIWNTSARIPSPSLALFIVMLPKAYLTSHCRMSGGITPLGSAGSLRSFLYGSSVYLSHLFLISSAGPYHFCLLLCPSLQEVFPGISSFL